MKNNGESNTDCLFDSMGRLKEKVKLHPNFLRPLYQYTSAEIRNWQRERMFPHQYN